MFPRRTRKLTRAPKPSARGSVMLENAQGCLQGDLVAAFLKSPPIQHQTRDGGPVNNYSE